MSLQARLERIKEAFSAKVPDEVKAVMHRATQALRASGLVEGAISLGSALPVFALPDSSGETVSSSALLARGPLVISFYRGKW